MEQSTLAHSIRTPEYQGEDRAAHRDAGIARLLSGPAPTPRAANAGGSGTGDGPDDPVSALIEAHRAARVRLDEATIWADQDALDNAEAKAAYDAASEAERAAFQALVQHRPATFPGLQAMLRYLADSPATDDEAGDFRGVMKAVASAAESLRWTDVAPAPAAEISLARMVATYFGDGPLDPQMTADIALRDRARAILAGAGADPAGGIAARTSPLPEPGSEEAKAAFRAACADADRLMQPARDGYPALKHPDGHTTWTKHGLSHALDVGEIRPAEYAKLYRLASERELRMDAAVLAADLGSLHALSYADEYPARVGEVQEQVPGLKGPADTPTRAQSDLKACTIFQLGSLYESIHAIREHVLDTMHTSSFSKEEPLRGLNPAGHILNAEHERLSFLFDAIEHEVKARQPADRGERDERLMLLLRHELHCEGRIGDKALLAEAVATWGDH